MKPPLFLPLAWAALAGLATPASAELKDAEKKPFLDRVRNFLMPGSAQKPVTPEERERRQRRIRALGEIFVVAMDEKIGATADQRERLRPLAERLVQGQAAFFPEPGRNSYGSFATSLFLGSASRATDEELSAILDSAQIQRWREACKRNAQRLIADIDFTPAPAHPSPRLWEPEDGEHAISGYLDQLSASATAAVRAYMTLKAEEATRVAGLAPDAARRLHLAALGAAEGWLAQWRPQMERTVRAGLADSDPRAVKHLLEGQDFGRYQRAEYRVAEQQPVWEEALARETAPAQRAAWQTEIAQRAAFRQGAIAELVLAELDRRLALSPEQCAKLEPRVGEAIADFERDAPNFFPSSSDWVWYQQSFTLFCPLGGLATELEATLTARQLGQWKGSAECAQITGIWASIHQRGQIQK